MKVFKTTGELQSYIISKMQPAIRTAQEKVFQIINRFVKEYYSEFSPEMYERTYQLYRSLVKSKIIPTGKGYECVVYFDLDALDYAMKYVNGSSVPNKGWSEEKTLESAMVGNAHGGYKAKSNTAIWTEAMGVLKTEGFEILRAELRKAGIPVK